MRSIFAAFAALALCGAAAAAAANRFESAVQHPGRSAGDLKRDAGDHPAQILSLTGIGPGMTVADMLAGDGYYTELLSYVVGPSGHVLMINNGSFDKWTDDDRRKRLADNRLPNVEYRVVDLDHMNLAPHSLDAIVLSKVYHDLYWVDTSGIWPKFDTGGVLDQLVAALRPGGVLLLVDHSAKAGHGSADASSLHRIDEAYARQDFGKRGLRVIATSELLRRADDPREQVSYKEPMLGRTDRFVLVFRKQAARR